MHKKEETKEKEAKKEEPTKPSEEILLLREIRDSLQNKKNIKKNQS